MLEKVIVEGNPTITFLTGVAGSGKSTATQRYSEELNNRGLVYDSALNRYGKLDELIKYAQEKGIKDVEVIAVYNDPITAFKNTIARGTRTDKSLPNGNGRLVPLTIF
jgi:Cdc6-like AAA superfamily ATPase